MKKGKKKECEQPRIADQCLNQSNPELYARVQFEKYLYRIGMSKKVSAPQKEPNILLLSYYKNNFSSLKGYKPKKKNSLINNEVNELMKKEEAHRNKIAEYLSVQDFYSAAIEREKYHHIEEEIKSKLLQVA